MSEEEAPASAYLRAVPKSVAGFVYTERGKSTKDTVNSIAHTVTHTHTHTHTITHLHVHRHAQTHTHNGHTALCKSATTNMETCTNIICHISKLKCGATLSCGIFFLLSVWSFFKKKKKKRVLKANFKAT